MTDAIFEINAIDILVNTVIAAPKDVIHNKRKTGEPINPLYLLKSVYLAKWFPTYDTITLHVHIPSQYTIK